MLTNQSLYKTGKYSDLTIKCQGKTWKCHQAIICPQSKPLAAALNGSFKEATTREIDLEEEDPDIVKLMLDFLYRGDYDDGSGISRMRPLTTNIASSSSVRTPFLLYFRYL